MSKKLFSILALLMALSLVLAACGGSSAESEDAAQSVAEESSAVEESAPEEETLICQVSDVGGIDDKSFNQTAYKGITDAEADFSITGSFLESQQQTDYEANINAFIDAGCELIITVGFLMDGDTQAAAAANPDQLFGIVDVNFIDYSDFSDITFDNVKELTYQTDEAAFLAGYVAASVSQTGIVATYGGLQFPTVTIFMDGFWYGVAYYNAENGTDVQVIGWDPATQTGSFAGNFESLEDGRTLGESFMDEGADVILPVAGGVGAGTAAAVAERGGAYVIGVDADFYETVPEYRDVTPTSVMKNMDASVYDLIADTVGGSFAGGLYVGTLENGGVGLAPFHNLDSLVSDDVKAALADISAGIIAGDIQVAP
jgi:basic membrane protein A